jgi:ribosome biogenesis GTPase A
MAARKGLFGLASTRAGEAAINWYPGHMASATKAIRERIKLVDLVLEVRDARIPLSSANAELQDALEHKKRLIVLNKMDLANPNMMLKWVKHFEACKQHHVFVNAHQQKAVKKVML